MTALKEEKEPIIMEEVAKQITDKLIKEERIENDRSHSTSKRSKSKPIRYKISLTHVKCF